MCVREASEDRILGVGARCTAALPPGLSSLFAALGPTDLTRGRQDWQPLHLRPGASSAFQLPQVSLCPRQVKIMTEKELLAVACEQFLGKNVQDIKNVVLQTLEGHLRSILGEALPRL